jgi:CRISPR-associated protein Cmr3
MTAYRFLEPVDVLYLRGNKLFGDPGSYGESFVPPWPSMVAGALRSALLVHKGHDPAAFARNEIVDAELGTPSSPGPFTVTAFHLAQRDQAGHVEPLYAPPADLAIKEVDGCPSDVLRMRPQALADEVSSSAPLARVPVLAERERSKLAGGYWLTSRGFHRYLRGETPATGDFVHSRKLWKLDYRVGVGLNPELRRAEDGKLFSVQAVALDREVGFLVGVDGAELPKNTSLRFGGDGHAATLQPALTELPQPDVDAICRQRRCRIVLTSPGIFAGGWLLPGVNGDRLFDLGGIRGRLSCAAVGRAEVVSGFDLAQWQPKPAQRAAPAGSVYWIEELDAKPDVLRKLVEIGLWAEARENPWRRAEGFNRFEFAAC